MVMLFPTKYMANDGFSEPPRRTDSKNSIFIFLPNFACGSPPGPQGSVSVIFWEARQLTPLPPRT